MPSAANADSSDLEKLLNAVSFLTAIRSPDDIFEAFGLATLPTAQKYGIIFGICVFTLTIITVMTLLVLGGSFKRIIEQENGGSTMPSAIEERINRPLLLERLLEAQERLLKNYPTEPVTEGFTNLTKMLMNIAPDVAKAKETMAALVQEEDSGNGGNDENAKSKKEAELKKLIPDGYEANYIKAYRKCQDKPGGTMPYCFSQIEKVFM